MKKIRKISLLHVFMVTISLLYLLPVTKLFGDTHQIQMENQIEKLAAQLSNSSMFSILPGMCGSIADRVIYMNSTIPFSYSELEAKKLITISGSQIMHANNELTMGGSRNMNQGSSSWSAGGSVKGWGFKGEFSHSEADSSLENNVKSGLTFTSKAEVTGWTYKILLPRKPSTRQGKKYFKCLTEDAQELLSEIKDCYYDLEPVSGTNPTKYIYVERDDPSLEEHMELIDEWEIDYGDCFISKIELHQFGLGVVSQTINLDTTDKGGTHSNEGGVSYGGFGFGGDVEFTESAMSNARDAFSSGKVSELIYGMPVGSVCYNYVQSNCATMMSSFSTNVIKSSIPGDDLKLISQPAMPSKIDYDTSHGETKHPYEYPGIKMNYAEYKEYKADEDKKAEESKAKVDKAAKQMSEPNVIQKIGNPSLSSKESNISSFSIADELLKNQIL